MTFVTPVLNKSERALLCERMFDVLPQFGADDKVLISDFRRQALVRIVRSDLPVIVGRALSGKKRG